MTDTRPSKHAEEMINWNLVFPNQANPSGNMFGGDVMAIIDTTAAMAAKRFSETQVSTVTVEAVHFAKPIGVGDNIKTTAKIVDVGNTSMIIKADVYRDIGANQLEKCVSAFLKFVAFDNQRKPTRVPELKLAPGDEQANRLAQEVTRAAIARQKAFEKIMAEQVQI